MENRETKNQIEEILKKIISNKLSNIEISQMCRIISQKKDKLGIDPQDSVFDIFTVIDSELDDFPPVLPSYDIDNHYLSNSILEINRYIGMMK